MKKLLIILIVMISVASISKANDCRYWFAQVDPSVEGLDYELDESDPKVVMQGIECLLQQKGNKRKGVFGGSKSAVSQIVPKASVEINALYRISELFYGNDDFARSVALIKTPVETFGEYNKIRFNRNQYSDQAFVSYLKWFEKVKEIGLEEARRLKLDPLADSGIEWY